MTKTLGNIELNLRNTLFIVLFFVGLGIFLYPFVNNWWYQNIADTEISEYERTIDPQKEAEYDAAFAKAQEYNKALVGQTVPDVFAIREGTTDEEYESFLNVRGNGMMGIVRIPAIDVRLPIYHYSTAETLEKGAGHIFGSSLPVGGESSHSVITAHRGLPQAKMFSDLDQVVVGDKFFLKILNRTLAYEVDQIETVRPDETRSLAIEAGEDLCTLVTCTPYGVNTQRLLVRGHRVPYVEGDEAVGAIRPFGILMQIAVAGAGVFLAILILMLLRLWRRRKEAAAEAAALPVDEPPTVLRDERLADAPPRAPEPEEDDMDAIDKKIARSRHRA